MTERPREDEIAGSGASKNDAGKIPVSRGLFEYFPDALMQVAAVSKYGADKYDWSGWMDVQDGEQRYRDARARHELMRCQEGEFDITDSNLPHLAQIAWNALAELQLRMQTGEIPLTVCSYDDGCDIPDDLMEPTPKKITLKMSITGRWYLLVDGLRYNKNQTFGTEIKAANFADKLIELNKDLYRK